MVGVGVGDGAPDPDRQARLAVFWRQYFNATGATLVSYAKDLTNFP